MKWDCYLPDCSTMPACTLCFSPSVKQEHFIVNFSSPFVYTLGLFPPLGLCCTWHFSEFQWILHSTLFVYLLFRVCKGRQWLTEVECSQRWLLIACKLNSGFIGWCRNICRGGGPRPSLLLVVLGISEWLPVIAVKDTTISFSPAREALPWRATAYTSLSQASVLFERTMFLYRDLSWHVSETWCCLTREKF